MAAGPFFQSIWACTRSSVEEGILFLGFLWHYDCSLGRGSHQEGKKRKIVLTLYIYQVSLCHESFIPHHFSGLSILFKPPVHGEGYVLPIHLCSIVEKYALPYSEFQLLPVFRQSPFFSKLRPDITLFIQHKKLFIYVSKENQPP